MKAKKTKRANLENKRTIIFQSGLVIALSLILVAFEWDSELNRSNLADLPDFKIEDDFVPITRPEKPKPKPQEQRTIEVLNIVDDIIDIDEEVEIEDSEADEFMAVAIRYVEDDEEELSAVPFYKVEEKPTFIGGDKALLSFLATETIYPPTAKEAGIQGKVYVQFVINEKGQIVDVQLARGVHPLLDKEALRVVKSMPRWEPGVQGGKKVAVNFHVPINFVLR